MYDKPLLDLNILVAEDDYLMATVMQDMLEDAGASIVGPVPSVFKAVAIIETAEHIDAAVLDVNLGGELVYPVADMLRARGIPIILTTGYDAGSLDPDYATIKICEKPFDPQQLIDELARVIPAN